MNYIDVTQNHTTHCVRNNTVVVTNREGIQGPPGRDGSTPYIDKATGNWCIAGMDTGVLAVGKPGETPFINAEGYWCIGNVNTGVIAQATDGITPRIDPETYHWIIGDVDTNVSARAVDGITPHIGENGNWFIGIVDTKVAAGLSEDDITVVHQYDNIIKFPIVGKSKDLYVDTSTMKLYRWDELKGVYLSFKSDYEEDIEEIIDAMNESGITIECGGSDEVINS